MARIKQIVKTIITLGVVAIALNFVFGNNTVQYIQKTNIGNTWLTWYQYDLTGYLRNIETTLTDTTELAIYLPTREWTNTTTDVLSSTFWAELANNLAVILDYIIMGLNIVIYPLKVGGYVLGIVLTLLGINLSNQESDIYWLCQVSQAFKGLAIPYI